MKSQNGWGGLRAGAGRPGNAVHVEECRRLDVRAMQRAGLFRQPWSGMWWWKDAQTMRTNASVHVRTSDTKMWLTYLSHGQQIDEAFSICKVPCNFGGHRVLLACPGCGSRRAVLHMGAGRFRCRACLGLTYETQSEGRLGRLAIKRAKTGARLGPIGAKPQGMHSITFKKLQAAISKLDQTIDDYIWARA